MSPRRCGAVLSAGFAALTKIFAKIGVENINSDLATFIRTVVVLFLLVLLLATDQFVQPTVRFRVVPGRS